MTDSFKNTKIPVVEALTMACCIYREKGYTSTSAYIQSDPNGEKQWNNKEHLIYQLFPQIASSEYKVLLKVNSSDLEMATEIVKHFRKLSFGVIGDTLNDYMERVFKVTQIEEVGVNDLGVLASVPKVYEKEVTEKLIKEEIKKTIQEHFGVIGSWTTLNIRYLRSRFVEKLNCYSHEAVTDTGYLVSFLNKERLGVLGTQHKIKARIKKHGEHYTVKTPETQLNYVAVVDNEFVWQ